MRRNDRTRRRGAALRARALAALALLGALTACRAADHSGVPIVRWYVFHEPSGAFEEAARRCSRLAAGAYRIAIVDLPADADQQREQLVRRLAAGDSDVDIAGMDVIWTAEFARAGWILPWEGDAATEAKTDRLAVTVRTATDRDRLWAAPFTSNTQLLWYRTDRVAAPPATWDEVIDVAESLGPTGTIQAQGQRYEGLTVFFVSLLASAGGAVLDESGEHVDLPEAATRRALSVMRRLALSPAADPSLPTAREDDARLAFERGDSSFMVNYTFVWPSARANAPAVAQRMGWARWPGVLRGRPSRVAVGGLNLGIGASTRHPQLAFRAASCLAGAESQRLAAVRGGLLPSLAPLYDHPEVRTAFPFAGLIRETLRDAVHRPQSPVYNDISLVISRTLHPMRAIDPVADARRLRERVGEALRSRILL